tara:strand:+ start:2808 stop:3242 length:435 start_codon:yes stop_codon:yes gene_type:complete
MTEKRGQGQPTKYKPEYCEQLRQWMTAGNAYFDFRHQVKVAYRTLQQWEKLNPEWLEAKMDGFEARKAFFEKKFIDIALGQDENAKHAQPGMLIFLMKNMNDWSDKNVQEVKTTGKIDYNINYEQITGPDEIKSIEYKEIDNDE